MKKLTIVFILLLVGCARQAQPNFYEGDYYMAGDDNCRLMRVVAPQTIMCMDENGDGTEYRHALTAYDMQQYQTQQITQQIQMAQLNQQLQQTGQSFQNAGQQILNQSQSYTAPQVQSYSSGSNTVLYNQVGSSLVGTNGTSCQFVGSSYICH